MVMAIKALNLTRVKDHELSFDPAIGTEDATKFKIGAIDGRIFAVIKDRATSLPVSAFTDPEGAMAALNMNQTNFDIVVYGLRGWMNFQDDSGNDVPFRTVTTVLARQSYLTADPELVKLLPEEAIAELANEIMDMNTFTETERKNSDK